MTLISFTVSRGSRLLTRQNREKKSGRPVKGLSQSEAKEKSVKRLLRFAAPSAGCMSFICDMIG